MGGTGSGDRVGHPFYGNQHGTGRATKGGFGAASKKYAGPTAKPPVSSRTTKHPESRAVVDDFLMGHKHEGGKVTMHEQHQKDKVEHLHVYRNGELLEDEVGDSHGVSSKSHDDLPDSDTIHNHPSGAVSFSTGDLFMTMAYNGNSASVVSNDGRLITLHRPEDGWKPLMEKILKVKLKEEFGEAMREHAKRVAYTVDHDRDDYEEELREGEWYKGMKAKIRKGELTTDDVDAAVRMETCRYALNKYGFDIEEGEVDK